MQSTEECPGKLNASIETAEVVWTILVVRRVYDWELTEDVVSFLWKGTWIAKRKGRNGSSWEATNWREEQFNQDQRLKSWSWEESKKSYGSYDWE